MLALFFFLFLLIVPFVNSQNVSSDETNILLSLKQHWGNPPALDSWNSLSSACDWPEVFCSSSNITTLCLAYKKINGTISSAICQLKNLVYIDLSNNWLSGRIPTCLYNFSNLEHLNLSRNHQLSGTIPDDIRNLSSLQLLDLSMNLLSGLIPRWLFRMHQLNYMSLANNNLTGTIPGELFCMQRLKNFISQWEHVYCGIPTPMQAYRLELVDFSNNNLNGSIPDDIRNLSSLQLLDLSMNLLSGSIPRWLFRMHQLNYMSLANNNLTGELPGVLDLYNLRELNLSHNNLHGVIPESLAFGDFFWLYSVDLSNNQLSGGILQLLNRLQFAGVVQICFNNFSGQIPVELINEPFLKACLDGANLCSDFSDDKTTSLPGCSSRLCSESILQPYLNCSIEFDNNITTTTTTTTRGTRTNATTTNIIAVAICSGIVGLLILGYLAKRCWKKARATIATRSNLILPSTFHFSDKDTGWEMISFHKLNFNKFDILSSLTDENLIGNGGSGKVYRAVISQTGVTVAVKSIWNDKKSDERLVKEFMAEIHTLGSIRHSNIVKLLCCISGKNTQLLVYQYFENKSLDQWLHNNKKEILPFDHSSITRLDWPMRLNIAIGVAQGLCYMHHHCSPPIIHRDIKSSNILLDSEFNAKIADFGLAKMLTTSEDTETASAVVGTFGYIAPEYAYTKRVNVKSDVYSFGAVLLELTTGRKAVMPDDHMNIAEWAQMRYKETSYIVNSLDDEIKESSFLDQIVAVFRLGVMCTIKTPANRPSMRDCLNILQDYSDSFSSRDQ